jgi:hypothetical protein
MKTNSIMLHMQKGITMVTIFILAITAFSYLYRHGISPVWAAVMITVFPGFFRFIYKTVCLLLAACIAIAAFISLIH